MCGSRRFDISLPLIAPGATVGSATFDFLEKDAPPQVWQSTAKAARNAFAESVLVRTARNAKCWGPSAWFVRGVSWSQVAVAEKWSANQTFSVLGGSNFQTAPPDTDFLWICGVSGDVAEGVAVPITTPGGGAPFAGWDWVMLPRQWWVRCPTTASQAARPFNLHLSLAALTGREEPTTIEWPV